MCSGKRFPKTNLIIALTIFSIGLLVNGGSVDAALLPCEAAQIEILKLTTPKDSDDTFGFQLEYFNENDNLWAVDQEITLAGGESYTWDVKHIFGSYDDSDGLMRFMVFENIRSDGWEVDSMWVLSDYSNLNVTEGTDKIEFDVHKDHRASVIFLNTLSVPIPGSVLLLGTGLLGMIGIRRKIRR